MDRVIEHHRSKNPETKLIRCSCKEIQGLSIALTEADMIPAPAEIARHASTIISMVPTGKHVRDVYLGDNGVMTTLNTLTQEERSATLCLDQSTIEQSVSKDVALAMRAVGADMVDAPVSGGMADSSIESRGWRNAI